MSCLKDSSSLCHSGESSSTTQRMTSVIMYSTLRITRKSVESAKLTASFRIAVDAVALLLKL